MVVEGCVQEFRSSFCVCACTIHLYQNSVVFLWVARLGHQAWEQSPKPMAWALPQEILLGTAAGRSRPALQELLSCSCFQFDHLNTINTIILTLPSFFKNQLTKPESGTMTFMLEVIWLLQ